MEIGRVCVKIAGRDAGRRCVVVRVLDEKFVEVTGPKDVSGVRRRKVNVRHLVPLPQKVEIDEGADDESVREALREANLLEEFSKGTGRGKI